MRAYYSEVPLKAVT